MIKLELHIGDKVKLVNYTTEMSGIYNIEKYFGRVVEIDDVEDDCFYADGWWWTQKLHVVCKVR